MTTNPTDRRERIAAALTAAAFECDGKCGLSEQECWDQHPIHLSAVSNGIPHVNGSVTAIADAVLAVLPSAADWGALVREADQLRREGLALQARAEEIDERMAALQQQVTEPTDRAAELHGADAQQQPDSELTAQEARDLADNLGIDLYRAQDALAFVGECCDIADREGRPVTTADVREWLKGPRCGRQLAAGAQQQPDTETREHTAAVQPAADTTQEQP